MKSSDNEAELAAVSKQNTPRPETAASPETAGRPTRTGTGWGRKAQAPVARSPNPAAKSSDPAGLRAATAGRSRGAGPRFRGGLRIVRGWPWWRPPSS